MNVVSLTQKLLSYNTINPPGNEAAIAVFTGNLLRENGFTVTYHEFGENRLHLIAGRGLSSNKAPIVLSGHFDTVPLGVHEWSIDPFGGLVKDGRLWGRGSSDMKGGLAAMIMASFEAFSEQEPSGGIRMIFTAGEELGCQGISSLAADGKIPGKASAVIVGEPTGNIPATGHKGAIYLNSVAKGITAHSSMPELGDNAIYKVAAAINRIKDIDFKAERDPLLGYPTVNVGRISGGLNLNSVPDHAEFTVDIRTTSKLGHETILKTLCQTAGNQVVFEKLVDLGAVFTREDEPFVRVVYAACNDKKPGNPEALPYLTDGAVLQKVYGGVPVIILGPGESGQAHKTDEYCDVAELEKSVNIYKEIILNWSRR